MAKTRRVERGKGCNPFGHKNSILLQALLHTTDEQRKALIKHADKSLIRNICECSLNILNGNIPLKDKEKRILRRHRKVLHKLIDPRCKCLKRKKKIINQAGGSLLRYILQPILTAFVIKFLS